MHRLVLGVLPGQLVDHIDGNTLDNRRTNLRVATARQNAMNRRAVGRVPYSGVRREGGQFVAFISPNRLQICLGRFKTAEQAAAAYNAAAQRCYGEYARLNPFAADWDALAEAIQRKQQAIERLTLEIRELSHAR
jgi:hypothetical protein